MMYIYRTERIVKMKAWDIVLPGEDIYATTYKHAVFILYFQRRATTNRIIDKIELEPIDNSVKVLFDSLIMPNKYQLN